MGLGTANQSALFQGSIGVINSRYFKSISLNFPFSNVPFKFLTYLTATNECYQMYSGFLFETPFSILVILDIIYNM